MIVVHADWIQEQWILWRIRDDQDPKSEKDTDQGHDDGEDTSSRESGCEAANVDCCDDVEVVREAGGWAV